MKEGDIEICQPDRPDSPLPPPLQGILTSNFGGLHYEYCKKDDVVISDDEKKPETKHWDENEKVKRPLRTTPCEKVDTYGPIDFSVDFKKLINSCRKLYGVEEFGDFAKEYEKYCSDRDDKLASKSPSTTMSTPEVRKHKVERRQKQGSTENQYVKEFSAPGSKKIDDADGRNKHLDRTDSGKAKNYWTRWRTVTLQNVKPKNMPTQDGNQTPDDDLEDIDGIQLPNFFKLLIENKNRKADKVEDTDPTIELQYNNTAYTVQNKLRQTTLIEKKDAETMTESGTSKCEEVRLGNRSNSKVLEKRCPDKLKSKLQALNLDCSTSTEEVVIDEDEQIEDNKDLEEIGRTSIIIPTGQFYTDDELLAMKPNLDISAEHVAKPEPESNDELDLSFKEFWANDENSVSSESEEELMQNPLEQSVDEESESRSEPESECFPGSSQSQPKQILEIKCRERPGKLPNSKHKVRKYKFLTGDDVVKEFVEVTYPILRNRWNGLQKRQEGEFRGRRPVPKHLHNQPIMKDIQDFTNSMKSIVCKRQKISGQLFDQVVEDTSPAAWMSPHCVQFEKSVIEGGPEAYLPSSFPASYCDNSYTLSLLRDALLEYSNPDDEDETSHSTDSTPDHSGMIKTNTHLAVPRHELYRSPDPILPGARFFDKPMDMVFTLEIYHPIMFDGDILTLNLEQKMKLDLKLSSVVDLLGSQSLGSIRDMFVCHADCYDTVETHRLTDQLTPVPDSRLTKEVSPRCAFLVDNTVLINSSEFESIHFAKVIQSWYMRGKPTDRVIEIKDSLQTRISEMVISLGEPYAFIHQENCQHIFLFRKARVCLPNEADDVNRFPRCISKNVNAILCRIDRKYAARWSVTGFNLFPEFTMLLCTKCVKSFCFDTEGNKRGKFQLYQFNPAV